MDKLNLSDWVSILSAVGMVLSVAAAISASFARTRAGAAADAELKSDVKHIREMVEANTAALAHMSEKLDSVEIRLARTEESCKSAHKRIDGFTHILPS